MRTIRRCRPLTVAGTEPEITSAPLTVEPAYSLSEAAEILGVSTFTARRLGKSGALRIIRVSPRRIIVRPADLRAYIASRPDASG